MKFPLLTLALCLALSVAYSQNKEKLYDPEADASQQIEWAIEQAKAEGKHVFLQIGGNWCGWCHLFHNFCKEDEEISQLMKDNYVTAKINHSRENRNEEILARYKYPQRFGFPVFVVLDGEGNYLHTQNTVYLEEGKGYNREKVMEFFTMWSPEALDPANYAEK